MDNNFLDIEAEDNKIANLETTQFIDAEKDSDLLIISSNDIKNLIYTIRGERIMIDRDLASLYEVETKVLNQAVKRNIKRFPVEFRFQLTDEEKNELVTNCDRFKTLKHSTSNPYCFTESGIAMLSSVLRSDIAIDVSIKIMKVFVEMRKFLIDNGDMFSRLDSIELNQLKYQITTDNRLDSIDKKVEQVFDYIAEKNEVSQKIFFDGQIYDAFSLLIDIVKKAKHSIILIDNYVDKVTLDILSKKIDGVSVSIYTSKKSKLTDIEVEKFNAQYSVLTVKNIATFHDRFIILDELICYHIGASIKDAGNKSFGITKIEDDKNIKGILARL